MKQQHEGYILVLTLIIMGILVVISTQMFYVSTSFISFARVAVSREKAKMLALSGVQMACDHFYLPVPKKEAQKVKKEEPKGQPLQQQTGQLPQPSQNVLLLKKALMVINNWQSFSFDQKKDGVEGEIKIYVACEDGKLHLNNLLSLMSQKGLGPDRIKYYQELWQAITKAVGAKKNLYASVLDFFDRRNRIWLNETTELLEIPSFDIFDGKLYVPLSNDGKESIYLTDLFTPQSRYGKLDPWVLSSSIKMILGLKPQPITEKQVEKAIKGFKTAHNWKNDWNGILKPLYGKDFNALPKGIELMFSPRFDPSAFSVISYGIVDDIRQGVYTILSKKQLDDGSVIFLPIKSYWIN